MVDGSMRTGGARGIVVAILAIALTGGIATSATGAATEYEFGTELPADATFAPGVSLDNDSAATRAGLSTRLAELARDRVAARPEDAQADAVGLAADGAGSLLRDGDRLVVNVRVGSTDDAVLDAIRASGAEIVSVNGPYGTVDAAVLPEDLRALAAAEGVEYVGENLVPMSASIGPAALDRLEAGRRKKNCGGAFTAEGDIQSGSAAARQAFGVDGSGQTVGIISDSYDVGQNSITRAKQDISSGDLPGRKNPCGFTSKVQVLAEGAPSDIDEGRAMAQIVHDMAPGARIAFASRGASEDDMAGAVRALANAGSTVITDDITFFSEPFFQEGPIANAVSEVTARGIPYFSSAANSNVIVGGLPVGSYEAPSFRSGGACLSGPPFGLPGPCMDFNPGPVNDIAYGLYVEPGSTFNVIMQWAEPRFGVTTDYDILFYDELAAAFQKASGTNNIQSQLPLEVINVTNPYPFPAVFDIFVYRASGAGTPRLKFIFGRSKLADVDYDPTNTSDIVGPTIMGHNGSLNSISTAAIAYDATSEPEAFSSHGPVVNYFGPVNGTTPAPPLGSPQVLVKPDITATDNIQNTFFLPSDNDVPRFSGTSAAAPAAAAVAALQRQANPFLTPAQILQAEKQTASPIGGFGPLVVGAGLINGQGAVGVNPPLRPNTKITKHPGKRIRGASARFEFSSDVPGAQFQCGLGKRPRYTRCSSPVRVIKIKRGAKVTFQVRAFNGKAKDKSPAKFTLRRAR